MSTVSNSEGSTIPFTPESDSDVFARLLPLNRPACEAFDAVVDTTTDDPIRLNHFRRFLNTEPRRIRFESIFTEDGDAPDDPDPSENHQWTGGYEFSLKTLPHNPEKGWYIGTNRGQSEDSEIDILLAPPASKWAKFRVAGKHARLFLHRESYRVVLEARHTVTIGRNGATTFRNSTSHVLEQEELISIGDCVYTFTYTDFFKNALFEMELLRFMREYYNPQWAVNKLLSPASVGEPISLGKYYCSPCSFAQGTFGKVTAGWTGDGAAVAIKHFKNPKEPEVRLHRQLMGHIGNHENVLQLLECVDYFNKSSSNAYCVYTPLARASLAEVIRIYQLDFFAKTALLKDFLNGLSFLHDQKYLMHRDINPNNLAVVSFNDPRGIIIDLDSVTSSQTSTNHMKGTLTYLAPEIVNLKKWTKTGQEPPPYDQKVDIWALGLSMFALNFGQPFRWEYFLPTPKTSSKVLTVTSELYSEYYKRTVRIKESSQDSRTAQLIKWITQMTEYLPEDRPSASNILSQVLENPEIRGKGTITLKSSVKRSFEA